MSSSSPWLECATDEGDIYYWNSKTDESIWEPPFEGFVPMKQHKLNSTQASKQAGQIPVQKKGPLLPPNWIECQDDDGSTYYWNSKTDESSWEFPVQDLNITSIASNNGKTGDHMNGLKKGINAISLKAKEMAKQVGETSKGSSCTHCGIVITGKFCQNCGTQALSMSYEKTKSGPYPTGPEADFAWILKEYQVRPDVIATLISQKVSTENMGGLTQEVLKNEFGISVWGDRVAVLNAIQAHVSSNGGVKIPAKANGPRPVLNQPPAAPGQTRVLSPPPGPPAQSRAFNSSPQNNRGPPAPSAPSTTWSIPKAEVSEPKIVLTPEQEEEKRREAEKKKTEDRKKREREAAKKEEDFVKNNERTSQLAQLHQKKQLEAQLQAEIDPAFCEASFDVLSYNIHKKNGKPDFVTFEISVWYGGSTWTIHRRWSQITAMDAAFKKEIVGYVPFLPAKPPNYKAIKFEDFLQVERRQKLHEYMQIVNNARPAIFNGKVSKDLFTKFAAPCQMGDKKDPNCIVPFKIIL